MDQVLLAVLVMIYFMLCCLPGAIARVREHHAATAITILGLLGFIFMPLFLIALAWSVCPTTPKTTTITLA